ncbi:MAG: ribonuclease J [Deltaproteobacteria bacterium]|nr:ribonuclease J [Deltaproteobacteria bacterium]
MTRGRRSALVITPLGGVGHFGRNCLLLEVEERGARGPALLVDCGARFVHDEAPGFDVGLPDLERIGALGERLVGTVITHGHEDHIGALPYAARENDKPLWATAFTARLIERRFARLGARPPAIDVVQPGDVRAIGPFTVRWLAVSHSIPDATALVIDTPVGRLVHSGDFRVDRDPVLGPATDLEGLTRAGDEGVLCLLADSTGAMSEGDNPGERSVGAALGAALSGASQRVAVALFASHVQRLQLLADACRAHGRRLALVGLGLKEVHAIARELHLVTLDDLLVDESDLVSFPRGRQCLAVTGTQGEPQSALSRLAADTHPSLRLERGDRLVMSARVIPGNEARVLEVLEALAERGVEIVDGSAAPHVSGHGYAGDLAALVLATRPASFVALHGNARNLLAHQALARSAGVAPERVVDLRDGGSLRIDSDGQLERSTGERARQPLAAFGVVEHFPESTIQARRRMATAGALVVYAQGGAPDLLLRGVAPALQDELLLAVRGQARALLAAVGTDAERDAVRAVARLFWRAGRPPPEIIVIPDDDRR